jgi:gas vesicle protein
MARLSKKQVFAVFLTGAATGAAAAFLYAPKSGAQTRRDISKFSRKAAEQFNTLQEDVREQWNEGYDQVMEVLDNVKEYVEDGKMRLQKLIRTA